MIPVNIVFLVANDAEDARIGMNSLTQKQRCLLLDQDLLSTNRKELSCINKTGCPLSSEIQVTRLI
jgi:hypothetical protein